MKRIYFCATAALVLSASLAHAGSKDIDLGGLAGAEAQKNFLLLSAEARSLLSKRKFF